MNFKKLSLILPLLCLNLKVLTIPFNTESVEIYSDAVDSLVEESLVEESLVEDIDLSGEDVEVVNDFSDDENLTNEISKSEEVNII